MNITRTALCFFALLIFSAPATTWAAAPQVVASIKPLHSLVAGVMEGVGTPQLLVTTAGSPHSYSLRPSQARALAKARLIFWIGPSLETFLDKPLRTLAQGARVISMVSTPEVHLLTARSGGVWEGHDHNHDHALTGKEKEIDPHLWLDPVNAQGMVTAIATALTNADPEHAAVYTANARRLQSRLRKLDTELLQQLEPVSKVPYIVFHDAYQYLEKHYNLNATGAISISPERAPGLRRLTEIRAHIKQLGARCIFSEPQFRPDLVSVFTTDTGISSGELDPLGGDLAPGPEAYFSLMRNLAAALRAGLESAH